MKTIEKAKLVPGISPKKVSVSIYDIAINSLDGTPISLSEFRGKKLLFVNVASECGFTKQYKELQKLHTIFKDKLVIIGLPCNQFGGQEPGTASQIKSFCETDYGVEFLITEIGGFIVEE